MKPANGADLKTVTCDNAPRPLRQVRPRPPRAPEDRGDYQETASQETTQETPRDPRQSGGNQDTTMTPWPKRDPQA